MCENKKLEYISITDHDTCKQYDDEIFENNNIFNGKIIIGSELHAVFQKKNIEIQEQRNILVKYVKNNNLYISGGSYYHGSPKPDIEIGVGRGDLSISKEILNWLYE